MDISLTSERVTRVLETIIEWRGKQTDIRSDNGPEFISTALAEYLESKGIEHKFIQPGKPMQNAFIERFNKALREDVLDAYIFESISQVKEITENWQNDYNENHPHESLGGISPKQYLKRKFLI